MPTASSETDFRYENAVLDQSIPSWIQEGFRLGSRGMLLSINRHFDQARRMRRNGTATDLVQSAFVGAHLKIALAATPFLFALLGVPLGLASRAGNRAMALGGALGISLVGYYPMVMLARSMGQGTEWPPVLLAWLANMVLVVPGIVVFYRKVVRDGNQ